MLQVKKIVGNLLFSNMYLLYENNSTNCWLIDIGDSLALARGLPNGYNVRGVFLTHTHYDHIGGINGLNRMFPQCIVYTSEVGKEALFSSKKNLSFYHDSPIVYEGDNISILRDGDCVKLFEDVLLYVKETPGHSESCLTYYSDEFVFTGDSFIPEVPVVTKLPGGNRIKSIASVKIIMSLANNRTILAGHDKDKWVPIL